MQKLATHAMDPNISLWKVIIVISSGFSGSEDFTIPISEISETQSEYLL